MVCSNTRFSEYDLLAVVFRVGPSGNPLNLANMIPLSGCVLG